MDASVSPFFCTFCPFRVLSRVLLDSKSGVRSRCVRFSCTRIGRRDLFSNSRRLATTALGSRCASLCSLAATRVQIAARARRRSPRGNQIDHGEPAAAAAAAAADAARHAPLPAVGAAARELGPHPAGVVRQHLRGRALRGLRGRDQRRPAATARRPRDREAPGALREARRRFTGHLRFEARRGRGRGPRRRRLADERRAAAGRRRSSNPASCSRSTATRSRSSRRRWTRSTHTLRVSVAYRGGRRARRRAAVAAKIL